MANKRILLCVTGLSPQIVTETLYVLATQQNWVPEAVHIVTTLTGARELKLNLLAEPNGWLHRLRADYALPPIALGPEQLHVVTDAAGKPLDDIRTPDDNTSAADYITEVVRSLTEDAQTELHVSIAGGRKTMGYYLGYALSLYGRAQDRLSHVLISDPYENNRQFYYPTPYEYPISVRRGDKEQTYDAQEARVDLAEIPFVRLREGLPAALQQGKSGFSQAIAHANRAQAAPLLRLDIARRQAWADEIALGLPEVEFLLLLWFAEAAAQEAGPLDWAEVAVAQSFLARAQAVLGDMDSTYERIEEALAWRIKNDEQLKKYFEPLGSYLNRSLKRALGATAAARYSVRSVGKRGQKNYELPLTPEQIEFVHTSLINP